ncbi:MerR family transcriptional regulator [Actinocatenispora sera]|uniref:HTH merR-type domain-containing protein n=1 Tax=Actinocatenispora sera TaxID=390989 RepID=A0A810KWA9_9ACTN|nr:MerR family transcriptional regulator [Actinocatenispora sera]BCJ27510.1 hypothetical protein Asera_16180 [Actinocatenispora sera]
MTRAPRSTPLPADRHTPRSPQPRADQGTPRSAPLPADRHGPRSAWSAGDRPTLRSGEVAAAAGVNQQTLRYYERRGLVAAPARTLGGHRQYPVETVQLLRTIKTAQRLGFTLEEIADLLALGARQGSPHRLAEAKLAEIERRIADLMAIRHALREAVEAGCDDLAVCAENPRCPLPYEQCT